MIRLTNTTRPGNTLNAPDASGTGRENPVKLRRTSAKQWALFLCPLLHHGGLGGAGSRLAGSLTPVSHPRSSRHPFAVRSDRDGSIHLLRSHP